MYLLCFKVYESESSGLPTHSHSQRFGAGEARKPDARKRPILRGRDIRRYAYDWAGLYLIATHNGHGKTPRIKIEDYPAVKRWLDEGGIAYNGKPFRGYKQIKDRSDQGDTPYNLRNCAYMDDFAKPKIVWAETMRIRKANDERFPRFSFERSGKLTDKTCFIAIGEEKELKIVLALLNSFVGRYQLHNLVSKMDDGGWLMQKIYLEQVRIPSDNEALFAKANQLVDELLSDPGNEVVESQIDALFEDAFGLSEQEVAYIHDCLTKPLGRRA